MLFRQLEMRKKRYFTKIMSLPLNQLGEEEGNFTSERNNWKGGERCGELLTEKLLRLSKDDKKVLITAYIIIASVFGKENGLVDIIWFKFILRVIMQVSLTK